MPCNGPCLKNCTGMILSSSDSINKMAGCTYINGNLEIALTGDGTNLVQALERNLQNVMVITGYLKIFRSVPLVSLNFLKNLKEIGGGNLCMNDYSLVVLHNSNLQELWNWTGRPALKIKSWKGEPKVLFHYNPRLCIQVGVLASWLGQFNVERACVRCLFELVDFCPALTYIIWARFLFYEQSR